MSTSAGAPTKNARGKPADPKDANPTEAQSAGSTALALQPLIAGAVAAQVSSQGSSAAAAAAGTDSSSDAATDGAGSAPPVLTGSSGGHAAVTPAVTAALTAPRQPGEPSAGVPASPGEDSHVIAAAPDSGGGSAAPVSAPFHAALQSALSAATRLDGASQSPATSPPGTNNDPASANAALTAAAAPAGADQTGASATPQTAAPVTVQVHAEVGSGGWANELGTRLHWMANQGIGSASLRLTPEQLGPVEVKISVHQNAASVWFSAVQPDTRSALEQALPRLRELFSAQGLNLAQAGVSDQSARSAPEQRRTSSASRRASAARELSATSVTSVVRSHQGLIDTYA